MLMLMMISFLTSLSFISSKHPMSMGFSLLTQTMCISLMTGMLNINFWYSLILFLIMVGGMLILFIYMTSVASNEKFKSLNLLLMSIVMITMMMMMMSSLKFNTTDLKKEILTSLTKAELNKIQWKTSLNKFITYPHNLKLFMMMSYLFLALIAIVKITNIKHGPLRGQNY